MANPQLNRILKGLDMLVYQALKRLLGSAQVRAVLDGSEYENSEEVIGRKRCLAEDDSRSNTSNGDVLASTSYLTHFLFEPRLNDDYEEDEQPLDPASIQHGVSHQKGPCQAEKAFPERKVT